MTLELSDPNEIHIWSTHLTISASQINDGRLILSKDEQQRGERLRSDTHKNRFIAARKALRQILSLYLNCLPTDIIFGYGEHKKPFLIHPDSPLQFNLAHSNDYGIYALTLKNSIGVDIEKTQPTYNQELAQRFFSEKENEQLMDLPEQERIEGFYRLWARKEAFIKAVGRGLNLPLSSFSVSLKDESEQIYYEDKSWTVMSLDLDPLYQVALASDQKIKKILYWHFFGHDYRLDKVSFI